MIFAITGKAGSGKDAILQNLIARGYEPIVSCTTRPMREGEQEGINYFFLTNEQFQAKLEAGELLEHRAYNTDVAGKPDVWYYGTPEVDAKNNDYVVVLDLTAAETYRQHYGDDFFAFGIDVQDYIREERAIKRGSFDRSEWDRRLKDDAVKFSIARMHQCCDMIISNEADLISAVDKVEAEIKNQQKLHTKRKQPRTAEPELL